MGKDAPKIETGVKGLNWLFSEHPHVIALLWPLALVLDVFNTAFPKKEISIRYTYFGKTAQTRKYAKIAKERLEKEKQRMEKEMGDNADDPEVKKAINEYYNSRLSTIKHSPGFVLEQQEKDLYLDGIASKANRETIKQLDEKVSNLKNKLKNPRLSLNKRRKLERQLENLEGRLNATKDSESRISDRINKAYNQYCSGVESTYYSRAGKDADLIAKGKIVFGRFHPKKEEPEQKDEVELDEQPEEEKDHQNILSPNPEHVRVSEGTLIYGFTLVDGVKLDGVDLSPAQKRAIEAIQRNGQLEGPRSLLHPATVKALVAKGILNKPELLRKEQVWTAEKLDNYKTEKGLNKDTQVLKDKTGKAYEFGLGLNGELKDLNVKPDANVTGVKVRTPKAEVELPMYEFAISKDVNLQALTPKQRAIVANLQANKEAPLAQFDMRSLKALERKGVVTAKPLEKDGKPVTQKYTGESYEQVMAHRQEQGTYIKTEGKEYVVLHNEGTITAISKDGELVKEGIQEFIDREMKAPKKEEKKPLEFEDARATTPSLVGLAAFEHYKGLAHPRATEVYKQRMDIDALTTILLIEAMDRDGKLTPETIKEFGMGSLNYSISSAYNRITDGEGKEYTTTLEEDIKDAEELIKIAKNDVDADARAARAAEAKEVIQALDITPAEYNRRLKEDDKYFNVISDIELKDLLLSPEANQIFESYDPESLGKYPGFKTIAESIKYRELMGLSTKGEFKPDDEVVMEQSDDFQVLVVKAADLKKDLADKSIDVEEYRGGLEAQKAKLEQEQIAKIAEREKKVEVEPEPEVKKEEPKKEPRTSDIDPGFYVGPADAPEVDPVFHVGPADVPDVDPGFHVEPKETPVVLPAKKPMEYKPTGKSEGNKNGVGSGNPSGPSGR